MDFVAQNTLASIAMFALLLVFVALGRRTGGRRIALDPAGARTGLSVIEGVVYALLGLVLAFTFNGANERYFARRVQIGNELNVIGTAYLRIDLLPPSVQPAVRQDFREYIDLRRKAIQAVPDVAQVRRHLAAAADVQQRIWDRTIAAIPNGVSSPTTMSFIPALNAMIDEQTTAQIAMLQHPPFVIEVMLVALMLLAAWFVGEAIAEVKRPSRLHVVGFCALLAAMFFLIRDLERPLVGLIRLDDTRWMVEDLAKLVAPR